jgi:hypothetical protein
VDLAASDSFLDRRRFSSFSNCQGSWLKHGKAHHPLLAGFALNAMILEAIRAILANILLALAVLSLGFWMRRILPRSFSSFDRLACSWLGGFGTLGVLLFLIGQWRFTRATIGTLLFASAAFAIPLVLRARRSEPPRSDSGARPDKLPLIPVFVIASVLLVTAVGGLAPITGDWGSDAVDYHYLGPKVWLRDGMIRPVPDNFTTAFPAIVETTYGALMAIGGDRAPGVSAVFTFSLFLLIVFSLATRAGLTAAEAWWAVALAASMPAVYTGAHTGFVDALYAAFVVAAARIGLDARRTRDYVAFGLFCGFALGTKYTGLLAVPILIVCAILLWAQEERGKLRVLVRSASLVAAVAALVAAPFYARNWILLGSPIYPPPPILANIFHVKYLPADAIHNFYVYIQNRGRGLGRGFCPYLLLPFRLTYHTSNFHGAGGIGLTGLALGPFGLIASRRDRFLKSLALLGVLLTTAWFVTQQESRFLIHAYALGAIFSVIGWRYVLQQRARASSLLCAVVVASSILYGLFMIARARKDEVHAAISPVYAERFRQERVPYVESFDFLNRDASVQRVLILDRSVPPFYCDRPYLKATGQWGELVLPDATDTNHVLGRVRDLGVSHVLDVTSELSGFRVPANMPGLTMVFAAPNQKIYRVD